MRAEIRERLSEKIPLSPSQPTLNKLLADVSDHAEKLAVPAPDNRCWLKLTTPKGEEVMFIPDNVTFKFRSRYGKAPGFEKWFLDRIREALNNA